MKWAFTPLILCCSLLPAAALADNAVADNHATFLAPFVGPDTFCVIRLDLTRLDVDAIFCTLAQVQDVPPTALDEAKNIYGRSIAGLRKAGAREIDVFLDLADLPANPPPVVVPLSDGADESALTSLLTAAIRQLVPPSLAHRHGDLTCIKLHGALVCARSAVCHRLKTSQAAPRARFASAAGAAADTPLEVIFVPSQDTLRVADEMIAAFSTESLSATPSTFRRGFEWSVLTVAADAGLRLIIQSPDGSAAEELRQVLARMLQGLGADPSVQRVYPDWDRLQVQLEPRLSGNRLQLAIDADHIKTVLGPALTQAQIQVSWSAVGRKLGRIGLAMHNYLTDHNRFPPAAVTDRAGKRLLSWRVAILPYIGEQQLYQEFHLNEAWDSEHNKKLIARMPDVFALTSPLAWQGKTSFLGVAGVKAMFPPDLKPLAIRDVSDGTSNTVWVVGVDDAHAVIWTKPEDYNYDPKNPRVGLLGHFVDGIPTLFVDGSAQLLPKDISTAKLNAYFTRNGGEIVDSVP
jgi:hypothetical protein